MYRKVDDFITNWQGASKGTQKVFEAMTDEKLDQEIADGHNSLGWLAWHLTSAPAYFLGMIGIEIEAPGDPNTTPSSAQEIVEGYNKVSLQILEKAQKLTDDDLAEKVDLHGRLTPRGEILRVLIDHQTHHRGQMTVLLRQADLVVPGVMGPTKEDSQE